VIENCVKCLPPQYVSKAALETLRLYKVTEKMTYAVHLVCILHVLGWAHDKYSSVRNQYLCEHCALSLCNGKYVSGWRSCLCRHSHVAVLYLVISLCHLYLLSCITAFPRHVWIAVFSARCSVVLEVHHLAGADLETAEAFTQP